MRSILISIGIELLSDCVYFCDLVRDLKKAIAEAINQTRGNDKLIGFVGLEFKSKYIILTNEYIRSVFLILLSKMFVIWQKKLTCLCVLAHKEKTHKR